MNKIFIISTLLSLACSSFAANTETINYYVIAKQAKPFQINEENKHSGIVTDIVKEIFKNSEYNIDYHTYPFNRMISILEAGGKPNWITYGSPSWGRVQSENLSAIPIYTVKHVLVNSQKNTFDFRTMADIENKVIVLLHGFDYPQLAPYFARGDIEELRVKDYRAAFRIIKKLPGDTAFVEMESRVRYNLSQQKLNESDYSILPFSTVIPDYPIYLAFDPNMDKDLQAFINLRLKELKISGKINNIVENYL